MESEGVYLHDAGGVRLLHGARCPDGLVVSEPTLRARVFPGGMGKKDEGGKKQPKGKAGGSAGKGAKKKGGKKKDSKKDEPADESIEVPPARMHLKYKSEIAAYEIDRLIGLDQVPPTVERKIRGRKGSLQLWVDDCVTEGERRRKEMQPPDVTDWNQQMRRAKVFFQLIRDVDYVNLSNLLIDPDFKGHHHARKIHEARREPRRGRSPSGEK